VIPLLRYAILRNSREGLLYALLFAPSVMLITPLLLRSLFLNGQAAYPMTLDRNLSSVATALLFGEIGSILCALAASAASFSVFREEMANRSLGVILLAAHPRSVVLASVVYGACGALAGFLLLEAGVLALVAHLPSNPSRIAVVVVCAVTSSALGAAVASISPDPTMLMPASAGALLIAAVPGKLSTASALVLLLVLGSILIVTASTILRRRCSI